MMKIIELVKMQLKLSFQTKSAIIFTFIMPMIFTLLFSVSESTEEAYVFYLADQDQSFYSRELINMIDELELYSIKEVSEEIINEMISGQEVEIGIIIPKGFEKSLDSRDSPTIRVAAMSNISGGGNTHIIRSMINRLQQTSMIANITSDILQITSDSVEFDDWKREIYINASESWNNPRVKTDFSYAFSNSAEQKHTQNNQASAGQLAFFLSFAMVFGAGEILREKEIGTLKRIFISNTSKNEVLLSKFIGTFIMGLIQIIILVSFGMFIVKVDWLKEPFLIIMLLLAFLFALTSIGILLTGLAKNYAQLNAIGILLIISTSMLGGTWWPLEIAPQWMQMLSKVTPQGWFMKATTGILSGVITPIGVWHSIGVLLLMGVSCSIVSLKVINLNKLLD